MKWAYVTLTFDGSVGSPRWPKTPDHWRNYNDKTGWRTVVDLPSLIIVEWFGGRLPDLYQYIIAYQA